ncbi:MAG: F0F1 ATP synthase subunit delta [Arachnia sp.]
MKARDAALLALNAKTDAMSVESYGADELFAVVDLLESQAPLRRSLSDPSSTAEAREALAKRLLGHRISESAMAVLTEVASGVHPSGRALVSALETQGVRAMLRVAQRSGDLGRVQQELHDFAVTVDSDVALSDALRNRSYPLEGRRDLVTRLISDRAHPITARLLARATAARVRTLPLTVQSYLKMAASLAGQHIARVTVARPLDDARMERLRRALEAQVGGPVTLQVEVDPEVLGGMNVSLGDHIIESTTAGRLEDARRLLTTT